jgi:adenosine deaminase
VPTGHDQFFATFGRISAVTNLRFVDMTVDQLKHYNAENVQYVEFMVSFGCQADRERFVKAIAKKPDDDARLLRSRRAVSTLA